MPLAKIHVREGQYDEARLSRVSSAVQSGLIKALGIPPEDFFQIIHVLPRNQFLHTPSFLGLSYSDDLIVLETLYETPGENISFGRGLAQRAHVSDRKSRAGGVR